MFFAFELSKRLTSKMVTWPPLITCITIFCGKTKWFKSKLPNQMRLFFPKSISNWLKNWISWNDIRSFDIALTRSVACLANDHHRVNYDFLKSFSCFSIKFPFHLYFRPRSQHKKSQRYACLIRGIKMFELKIKIKDRHAKCIRIF